MDRDDIDPALLERSLRYIRRINGLLGYTRATLSHLERFSRRWKPGERIDLLDVATGSADVPAAILCWADHRAFDVRIVAIDRHEATARTARRAVADPRLQIVRASALSTPFAPRSFDYVLSSMFLHHLPEAEVVEVLRSMSQLARRGIIVADLLRRRRAYLWISLFTLAANPIVRHDARVSVAQAFTESEMLSLCEQAGINFARFHRHFGHRFVLAGEK